MSKINSNLPFSKMSTSEKKEYYELLKSKCLLLKSSQLDIGQDLIKFFYPSIRNYKLIYEGYENIPKDSNVLFVVNHSNSHDIFTAYEMFSQLNRKGSVMVATDCLNPLTIKIFNISNATLLDRRNKIERSNSVLELSKKILDGYDGLIFGEGTWNLHPFKPMQNIQNGAVKVSLITQVPIVPVIFEYNEIHDLVSRESCLFDKCTIRFGKPIMPNYDDLISLQSQIIKNQMELLRKGIWEDNCIKKDDFNQILYLNHTYAKKYKALGFIYDSLKEQEFLFFNSDENKENEYTLTEDGKFIPGITEKNSKLRKILKI